MNKQIFEEDDQPAIRLHGKLYEQDDWVDCNIRIQCWIATLCILWAIATLYAVQPKARVQR